MSAGGKNEYAPHYRGCSFRAKFRSKIEKFALYFAGGINKKARKRSGLFFIKNRNLFQLRFFVFHMLACHRIIFLNQKFFRHVALVFGGGVEVTRARAGLEFDFFTCAFGHDRYPLRELDFAARAQVCEHSVDAVFVNQANCRCGHAQANPTIFRFDPETTRLQVRHEATTRLVVGVGNVVSRHGAFASHGTDFCHKTPIKVML
jgi:hypothetical protein